MRGMPSRSAGGSEGAPLLPASIDGELDCRWKSPDATNVGSAEMLPDVPTTCEQLPCVAGPAELERSLWSKTGGVDEWVVSHRTAGTVEAAATMLLKSWTCASKPPRKTPESPPKLPAIVLLTRSAPRVPDGGLM